MLARGVQAYVVKSTNSHQSEYVAACDERLEYLSGFSGSYGTGVVTADSALLWTDGRYYLQAKTQLKSGWALMREDDVGVPSVSTWLASLPGRTFCVGVNAQTTSVSARRALRDGILAAMAPGRHVRVANQNPGFVDATWESRPPRPAEPIFIHPLSCAGTSASDKIRKVATSVTRRGADAIILTSLEEIAWVLNLRGNDIPYNPLFSGYLLVRTRVAGNPLPPSSSPSPALPVSSTHATLFVQPQQAPPAIQRYLLSHGVTVRPLSCISEGKIDILGPKGRKGPHRGTVRVWIDPETTSIAVRDSLRASARSASSGKPRSRISFILAPSPVGPAKAVKNECEVRGVTEAHHIDGVAMCKFLHWLDVQFGAGEVLKRVDPTGNGGTASTNTAKHTSRPRKRARPQQHTEWSMAQRLHAFRAESSEFVGPSFRTISAAGPNAALAHHQPSADVPGAIAAPTMYLFDSGGQYRCGGTTDITRTVFLSGDGGARPTAVQKRCFTRVLQGHIALASAVFPRGTTGPKLDVLARTALWSDGLDYSHGTGHGVGAFLGVHEGPQEIGANTYLGATPLQPNMLLSNEPGYYREGAFGIRTENVMIVRDAKATANGSNLYSNSRSASIGGKGYLKFETLSLAPIQKCLIDFSLLSRRDVHWLNAYHERVWGTISQRLGAADGAVRRWLREATAPVQQRDPQMRLGKCK